MKPGKAVGLDGISPRLLHIVKAFCLVPVSIKSHPTHSSDYRPVALTSYIMKKLERLVLAYIRPRVGVDMDPPQFAYQPNIGVDDALIYILQRVHEHLDNLWCNSKDYVL